jgi:hypothetical protein
MTEPKLAPPGAGVPFLQMLYMRAYLGPLVAARATWPQSRRAFEHLYGEIELLSSKLSDERMVKRVLVAPMPGLEDSSRYWSPAMVLEHLVIVGVAMERAILELSHGRVPPGKADTAKVKPLGQTPVPEIRARYRDFYQGAPARIEAAVGDWRSKARMRHPWFGPFNARQWAWVLGAHAHIHRRQLREIIES